MLPAAYYGAPRRRGVQFEKQYKIYNWFKLTVYLRQQIKHYKNHQVVSAAVLPHCCKTPCT